MPHTPRWARWPVPSFDELKGRAKEIGGSTDDVLALVQANDPYAAGRPHRARAAEWFAAVWETLEIRPGWHLRRIHYLLVSRPQIVPWGKENGKQRSYQNTLQDWYGLCHAARDAAALSLVPPDILSDARNDEPLISLVDPEPAEVTSTSWDFELDLEAPEPPQLRLSRPTVPQPFHVEIWAEKTTVNDVLRPLAQRYGLNIVTASGEISATACRQLVERAIDSEQPVRILYVSDFDPAGQSIPLAMARKVEYEIDRRQLDLDIQVRPVVLTHAQCIEHQLPRSPIKDSERRAAGFEERYGEGATELDALEALHPGVLQRILVAEIERYRNPDHTAKVAQACLDFERELDELNEAVTAEFEEQLAVVEARWRHVMEAYERYRGVAEDTFKQMREDLITRAPAFELPDIEFEADEDPDPLFDSRRDYLEQLAAYKRFQGKNPILPDDDDDDVRIVYPDPNA